MPETEPVPSTPPPALPELRHTEPPRSGCLRWGLIGCALLSVLLIVGLVIVGTKGVEWALVKLEDQTLAACTPEVTEVQKEAFRNAYTGFIARARMGKEPAGKMTAFRSKLMAAIADGKVTPEELTELTAAVGEPGPRAK